MEVKSGVDAMMGNLFSFQPSTTKGQHGRLVAKVVVVCMSIHHHGTGHTTNIIEGFRSIQ